jgi:hypothetical protein
LFRRRTRTVLAALTTLLLLGAAVPPVGSGCRTACCVGPMGKAALSVTKQAASHSCCCGSKRAPCDLARGEAPSVPHAVLPAAPKPDGPTHAQVQVAVDCARLKKPIFAGHFLHHHFLNRAPPGPIYLQTLSLLC